MDECIHHDTLPAGWQLLADWEDQGSVFYTLIADTGESTTLTAITTEPFEDIIPEMVADLKIVQAMTHGRDD